MENVKTQTGGKLTRVLRSTGLYPLASALKRWGSDHNPFALARQRAEIRAAARFYGALVRPGDLCFDVGAHAGVRTDVFLKLGARVVAVEPQAHLAQGLQRKYRGDDRVSVIPKGLDEKEGQTTLYICDYSTCSSMSAQWIEAVKDWNRLQGREWSQTQNVAVTTLDRLIEEFGVPAFCKIDVEGFEWNVLKGLSRPLPALSFEYNPRHLAVVGQCVAHLHGLGDYEFNYSEGDSMTFVLNNWIDYEGINTVLRDVLPNRGVYGDIYARLRGGRPNPVA